MKKILYLFAAIFVMAACSDNETSIGEQEIRINYNGATATVNVSEAMAKHVTVNTDGAHVTVTNNNATNEAKVTLSGSSTDGSLTYNGIYKATFVLNGLQLTSSKGPALNIMDGKRIALVLAEGSNNALTDATGGTHKGALYCKGHMEIEGSGSLTVTGHTAHAISVKEYLQLKRNTGSITIGGAVKDAIHCGQYFLMNGSTITIDANTKGDGIQVERDLLDDGTPDPDTDNTGELAINSGKINMIIAGEDCEGLKSDATVNINGGNITIAAKGNGSRGIAADGNITIDEAKDYTTINITAEGGKCNVPEDRSDPHRCMGIRGKANLTINAGTVSVKNAEYNRLGSRGIKVDGLYTKGEDATVIVDSKIIDINDD